MNNAQPHAIDSQHNPDPLKSYLDYYKKLHRPGYAVLINGEWGIGKTYQVNEALKDDDCIYVSLFGLQSAEEIYLEVLSKADPGAANRIKLKAAAKGKSVDLSIPAFGFTLPLGDLLSASIDGNVRRKIEASKIIVIDDLERCTLDLNTKLGIINFYCEHCGCPVVVIAHDEKIASSFSETKEKVFGQTIRVLPRTDEALDFFISTFDVYKKVELKNHANIIKNIFTISQCKSLRVLKQVLFDAVRFFNLFDKEQIQNIKKFQPLFEIFLAFDFEVRDGKLDAEDIITRDSALYTNIAVSMNSGSHGNVEKTSEEPSPFIVSRKKFEDRLDLNNLNLSDEILVQMIVDGQYDKPSLQNYLNSNSYFAQPSKQPAWLRFINLRSNEDNVVEEAAAEMDKQFTARSCEDLGEFLHIVSLRFMRSQNKLIADSYEVVTAESKSYLDDLVKQERFPVSFDEGILRAYHAHGGYSFWNDAAFRSNFDEVRSYISECHAKAIQLKMPKLNQKILDLFKSDPEGFIASLGTGEKGTGDYYSLPVLSGIATKDFVDQFLATPFAHWRALHVFLGERMRRSKHDQSLQSEQKWFADLVAEMNGRSAAFGNTVAALRLRWHIPEQE